MQKRSEIPNFTLIPEFRESENLAYLSSFISKGGSSSTLPSYTTTGAVSQLRQSLPIWDEHTLNAIGEQRFEGFIEIYPLLSKEVRSRIVSKLQSFLQEASQGENGSVQESDVSGSNSDIAQQVQAVMSKPQKKTDLFRMAGVIKEPFFND